MSRRSRVSDRTPNDWDKAMSARLGLLPAKAPACPRVVAGKRCARLGRGRCVCEQFRGLFDHSRMWVDQRGAHVFTAEPYHVDTDTLQRLRFAIDPLGLVADVGGDGGYGHGTTLIQVRKRPAIHAGKTDPIPRDTNMGATVKLYRTDTGPAIYTDANDERAFMEAASAALAEGSKSPEDMAAFLPHVIDIACKLRGYKAPTVIEKRVLISGVGVLPDDALIAHANGRGLYHAETAEA